MLCGQKKPLPASGIFRLWIRTVSTSFDYQSDWHCAKTGEILHAPKASLITSQIDTAPKPQSHFPHMEAVWLPVRLTLRQNYYFGIAPLDFVWLPVRLTLRQNPSQAWQASVRFDYQSDWHCAKTSSGVTWWLCQFDYQSDWHCAKTL